MTGRCIQCGQLQAELVKARDGLGATYEAFRLLADDKERAAPVLAAADALAALAARFGRPPDDPHAVHLRELDAGLGALVEAVANWRAAGGEP